MSTTAGNDPLLSARALGRFASERGAQLVVLALIIGLGLDSALILTRALSAGAPLPAASPGNTLPFGPRSHNPQLLLAQVVDAHLFGAAPLPAGANAPPTTLPLILTGVIADPRYPTRGQAIIGSSAANAKLYSVGAAISGGAHLHAVYPDRVLLERNGALETLRLPRTPLAGAAYLPPQAGAEALSDRNASVLAGLLRAQPVFSAGKLSGYRIFPGGERGLQAFTQLGLRPGDLVTAINGTNLDDPTRALEVLQTLSSSGSASVTVTRNGAPLEVNLNLANLSGEEQDGDSGQAAGPAPMPSIGPTIRRRPFAYPGQPAE